MKTRTKPAVVPLEPLPPGAVLMAIDCSSTAIGYAIFLGTEFAAASLIKHPASWPSERRIRANTAGAMEVILDRGVTHAAVEWQSPLRAARCRNANGLAVLGQAQGYLLAAIEREFAQVKVDLIGERLWTKRAGWNVSKERRAREVMMLVPEYRAAVERDPGIDRGLDVADAIGLAMWRLAV